MICLIVAVPATEAKKKGRGGVIDVTKTVNLPIPDKGPPPFGNGPDGVLTSTIDVGKRFKGRQVRDVNVSLQTLGVSGMSPAGGLQARLVAPNGANTYLFTGLGGNGPTNPSIGPLTLDDEAALDIGTGAPTNPTRLYRPWSGTAAPQNGQLWPLDGGPARGAWTLNLFDRVNGETSNLVFWRIVVTTGRPFRVK